MSKEVAQQHAYAEHLYDDCISIFEAPAMRSTYTEAPTLNLPHTAAHDDGGKAALSLLDLGSRRHAGRSNYAKIFDCGDRHLHLSMERNPDEGGIDATVMLALQGNQIGNYEIVACRAGGWWSCARWLAGYLKGRNKKIFYKETGLHEKHLEQAEANSWNVDSSEECVASILTHCVGLPAIRERAGAPCRDITVFNRSGTKSCLIQAKYDGKFRSSLVVENKKYLAFVVVVAPVSLHVVRFNPTDRQGFVCYIVPANHIDDEGRLRYRYESYKEDWKSIAEFLGD